MIDDIEDIEDILKQKQNIKDIIKKYDIDLDDPLLAFIEMEHSLLKDIVINHIDLDNQKKDIEQILKEFKFKFFMKTEDFNKNNQDFYIKEKNKLEQLFNMKINDIDIEAISKEINSKVNIDNNKNSKQNIIIYSIIFTLGNIMGASLAFNFFI